MLQWGHIVTCQELSSDHYRDNSVGCDQVNNRGCVVPATDSGESETGVTVVSPAAYSLPGITQLSYLAYEDDM